MQVVPLQDFRRRSKVSSRGISWGSGRPAICGGFVSLLLLLFVVAWRLLSWKASVWGFCQYGGFFFLS